VADDYAEWWLENAEERNAERPDSFFIPAREKRHSLQPGDLVKLLFAHAPAQAGTPTVERMWVEVISTRSGSYAGTLRSRPDHIASISEGDGVTFGPEHVAAFDWSPEELGYDAGLFAWARKDSSRPGGVRPTRVALRPTEAGASDGDSGWLLGNGDESQKDFNDSGLFSWSALGWLSDLYPELEAVFRSGEGSWRWDDASGAYRRVD
jgi:hypothetical protein